MKIVMEHWWSGEGEKRSAWTKTCHIFTLRVKRDGGLKNILEILSITIGKINIFFSSGIPVEFRRLIAIYNTFTNLLHKYI
jgi:hypothetical protein